MIKPRVRALALCCLPALTLVAAPAAARTLEAVRSRGAITLCAHANALPFASRQDSPPGFQIEIARALAPGTLAGAAVTPATVGYFNMTHPAAKVRLVHAYENEPLLSWNIAVGMRGSDAALRQAIDTAIGRLLADGTIRDIYARYGIE